MYTYMYTYIYISHMYFTKWFYHFNIITVIAKPGTPLISQQAAPINRQEHISTTLIRANPFQILNSKHVHLNLDGDPSTSVKLSKELPRGFASELRGEHAVEHRITERSRTEARRVPAKAIPLTTRSSSKRDRKGRYGNSKSFTFLSAQVLKSIANSDWLAICGVVN